MKAFVTLLSCCFSVAACAEELGVAAVRFERHSASPEIAYSTALVFEAREQQSSSLTLTKAALAFDMSNETLAQRQLMTLDRNALGADEQRQLRLYLARLAYNADRTEALRGLLDAMDGAGYSPWEQFLRAESARVSGNLGEAEAVLASNSRRSLLTAYGQFNLALSFLEATDKTTAIRLLNGVLRLKSPSPEHAALRQHAGIALASIDIDAGDFRSAWRRLRSMDAASEAGILGLVLLARRAAEMDDYATAAAMSSALLDRHPFHPATVQFQAALPWFVERAEGGRTALGMYADAAARLEQRIARLNAMPSVDVATIVGAVAGDVAALQEIDRRLGDRSWFTALTSDAVHDAAERWLRLRRASTRLSRRRDNLDALLAVGEAQSLRFARSRDRLQETSPGRSLNQVETAVGEVMDALAESPPFGDGLRVYANEEEQDLLDRIDALLQRSLELPDAVLLRARIARTRHVVLYRIHADLPARMQHRRRRAESLLVRVTDLRTRLQRVEEAMTHYRTDAGLPARIDRLISRTERMSLAVAEALDVTGEGLLAAVGRNRDMQIATMSSLLLQVELAMARIGDELLLAAGDEP